MVEHGMTKALLAGAHFALDTMVTLYGKKIQDHWDTKQELEHYMQLYEELQTRLDAMQS
jgi:hypothetical protein